MNDLIVHGALKDLTYETYNKIKKYYDHHPLLEEPQQPGDMGFFRRKTFFVKIQWLDICNGILKSIQELSYVELQFSVFTCLFFITAKNTETDSEKHVPHQKEDCEGPQLFNSLV